jgi:16S rRNA (cytosine967-C5)-methyltransferase
MRAHSYLNTADHIIRHYDGSIPLAAWLKIFFRSEKKFGASDRKQIAHLCYCFYRLGNAFQYLERKEKMLRALFLCSASSNIVLRELAPEWEGKVSLTPNQKLELLSASEEANHIFPFMDEVSEEIDADLFNRSFLIQPDLYLRIRPGKKQQVVDKLQNAGIGFHLMDDNCIGLANQVKIEDLLDLDVEAVVQDASSQQVIQPLLPLVEPTAKPELWDCCAASGGKSILFHDHFPNARLTVSDVRKTILVNLHKRFQRAGIRHYDYFIADVAADGFEVKKQFDIIICDAPCSGSGTWSRMPEQLYFFKKEKIVWYAGLQKKIVEHASKALKKNGIFLYITCSVFKKENEEVLGFIQENLPLQLQSADYFRGYTKKADTLFATVFRRS